MSIPEQIRALERLAQVDSELKILEEELGQEQSTLDGLKSGIARLDEKLAADNAALRAVLERAVPKTRGDEFVDLMEELAHDTCVEGEPDCPRCELRKICPTGQDRKTELAASTKAPARAKEPKAAPAKGKAPRPK